MSKVQPCTGLRAMAKKRFYTLQQIADSLERPANVSTVTKWVKKGLRGVKLKANRVGGRILVPEGALAEFQQAVDAAREGVSA